MTQPIVSVIMPVRNGAMVIGDQLEALANQDYLGPFEVIIADNGSTDGTRDVAALYGHRLHRLVVIDASERPGANHARNLGAAAAAGEVYAFCDADDVVDGAWLDRLIAALTYADLVGGALSVERLNDDQVLRWRPVPPLDELRTFDGFLPYAVGANLGIRASVFHELGGFHPGYPTGDDVEIALRARLAGFEVAFAPDALVHYRFRGTLRELLHQSIGYGVIGPHLYHDYRDEVPPSRFRDAARAWARLAVNAPLALVRPELRGTVVRGIGLRVGRIQASLQNRVVYL